MATYQLTSQVEFDNSYSGSLTAPGVAYATVLSAFSVSTAPTSANIVSVSITTGFNIVSVINAGYYSHITDNPTIALSLGSTFDIGYTSQASTTSLVSSTNNTLKSVTYGPGNANAGYGTLEIGGTELSGTLGSSISFGGIDNTLIFDASSIASIGLLSAISNFQAAGDQIVFNGVAASRAAITGYSNGVLTFSNGGITSSLALGGMAADVTAGNFAIGSVAAIEGGNSSSYAGNLVISFVPCFLRGTMIAIPGGEVAVERLRAGDLVTVIEGGQAVVRPVRWTGGSRLRTADHGDSEAAFPVRIRRGAFDDNVPHRDLLVTPEHCVLTEAGLVPARMLVNGASIVIDRSITDYEYFHVELDRHGILLSEGLRTESYLESGRRDRLGNAAAAARAAPATVPAAPLAVARAVVEPIWARLAERARGLGIAAASGAAALTDQPDLRLLLDDGRELSACWHNATRHMFHLPRGSRALRLLSRAAVPAEVVGPFVDDRRRLGVAIDRLVLWEGLDEQVVPARSLDLVGWHPAEGTARWTDGNAALDLPPAGGDTFLDIHVAGTMLYPADRMAA